MARCAGFNDLTIDNRIRAAVYSAGGIFSRHNTKNKKRLMNLTRFLAVLLSVVFLSTGIAGCQKDEGAAEKTGKTIDGSADKAGEAVKDAGEDIKKAVE